MTRSHAVLLMILVTLLWSLAGIVSRQLESAASFEVTFWRSSFNAITLCVFLSLLRGRGLWTTLRRSNRVIWLSGLCWAVMFTAFMIALTLTTVANVLIIMAFGPLLTALLARIWLGSRLAPATGFAILVAGGGITGMFVHQITENISLAGSLIALAVPLAAAINWTLLQRQNTRQDADPQDMLPAVLIGAIISALGVLPFSYPFHATLHDLGWLAFLGAFQLALPCLLVVRITRTLAGSEIALLALLEVVFGVAWVWLGAGEQPSTATLAGGTLVIAALLANELLPQT